MFSMMQAALLVGLGVIVENPDKRKAVLKSLDGIGKYAMNSINTILPKGGASPKGEADPPEYR